MKLRSAIVFPDTVPSVQMLIPLVLVFEPLVYFQTVENDRIPPVLDSPLVDEMTTASLCRIDVPAPLEHDRERFLQLIADISNRQDDYVAQLSHVSLAAVSSAGRRGKESKSSIVSRLLAGKGIKDAESDTGTAELWQARLVLKLGEIFDADQERLRLDLQRMDDKRDSLLGALRKETDSLFSRAEEFAPVSPMTGEMMHLRCKAWSRIFVSGGLRLQERPVFVSGNKEAVELLIDTFEQITGQPPLQKCFFSLPAQYPDKGRLPGHFSQFKNEGAGVLEKMFDMLEDAGEGVPPGFAAVHWEALVEKFFPEDRCGRVRLCLYFCRGISARHLFAETFSHDKKSSSVTAEAPGFFLGVLEYD